MLALHFYARINIQGGCAMKNKKLLAYPALIKQMRELDSTRMIYLESYGTDGGVDLGSGMY